LRSLEETQSIGALVIGKESHRYPERVALIGTGQRRREGREKVTGAATYVADLDERNLAHARLLLSPHAHADLAGVDISEARNAPGVIAVFAGDDLPPLNAPEYDLPLARDRVIYTGQPVVAVVAESREQAADAIDRVVIDWRPRPAIVDPLAAARADSPMVLSGAGEMGDAEAHGASVAGVTNGEKPPNVTAMAQVNMGDARAALAAAAQVTRARYISPAVHQGFLEPHAAAARVEPDGRLTIWAATQGIFFNRRRVAEILNVPVSTVRVLPMTVGGGFGGKIVLLEPLIALLAKLTGRMVLLELTRTEEFLMGRGAPGAIIDLELGADETGRLVGAHVRGFFDNGAGPGAMAGFAPAHLTGAYGIPNVDYIGYDIATNKAPQAAYRAPGAPQVFFALESAMDELARQLGKDPLDFRALNAVREGDVRATGGRWPSIGLQEVLERARKHPLYTAPTKPDEGIGVAVGGWGGGLESAAAVCRVESDGTLQIQVGSVDISGTDTAIAMIAADIFGVSIDQVRIEKGDTSGAPYAGIAGGSKTIYTVTPAVIDAVQEARRQILEIAAEELEVHVQDLEIEDGKVQVKGAPSRALSVGAVAQLGAQFGARYAPVQGQGRAAVTEQSPMFTVHIARVHLDRETGSYEITGYAAIQDVGRALNPPEVLGQIHGGTLQGLGRVYGEELVYTADGQLQTASFVDYAMPTIDQSPDIQAELVEVPSPFHPLGAKGVGEPPAIPPAAAVANAIRAAGGPRLTRLPITPEAIVAGFARSDIQRDQTTAGVTEHRESR
jgi:CO/xanthine dehydrogenase Mo-binding subunit